MKAYEIAENIYEVGAVDWNIRNFHGYETPSGTSYNAYLILDEKVTLIDTVKAPFTQELIDHISAVIAPEKIDIIISNHVEPDHSGGLPAMRALCPNAEIYTIAISGEKGLTAYYGNLNVKTVKSGESLSLGRRTLQFVATPMLHWPDNMVTYCPEDKILFSNDAFGQHLATTALFDEEVDLSLALYEAKRYYANIVMCYGRQARKAWETVCELSPAIIAPSHGVIWRKYIADILDAYDKWSENAPKSDAIVIFDSMWHSTEMMAQTIVDAFRENGIASKLYDLKGTHPSHIVPEVLTSKYIAVGSPTLNNQMLPSVAAFLCYLKGLSPKDREAFAFGSYGWGGQSVGLVEKELQECGFHICMEGAKINYRPTKETLTDLHKKITDMLHAGAAL